MAILFAVTKPLVIGGAGSGRNRLLAFSCAAAAKRGSNPDPTTVTETGSDPTTIPGPVDSADGSGTPEMSDIDPVQSKALGGSNPGPPYARLAIGLRDTFTNINVKLYPRTS